MALADCPNPECNEGHIWQKGEEECTCPVKRVWIDEYPYGGYYDGFKQHDVMTCETICPCCCGREEVLVEEAEDWIASQGEAA